MAGTSLTWLGRNWPGAWVCAVIVFACPAVGRAAGEYRTFEVESLKIEFDSEWAMQTSPGYLPVRVDITNLGNARVIEIVGEGTRFFRSGRSMVGGATEVSQSVRLARGDRVRLTIPVPVFGTNENIRFEIRENGKMLERLNYTGFQSASAPAAASALDCRRSRECDGVHDGELAEVHRRASGTVVLSASPGTGTSDDGRVGHRRRFRCADRLHAAAVASADQLAGVYVAARRHPRAAGMAAAQRSAEERSADMDGLRRRPGVRGWRPAVR